MVISLSASGASHFNHFVSLYLASGYFSEILIAPHTHRERGGGEYLTRIRVNQFAYITWTNDNC